MSHWTVLPRHHAASVAACAIIVAAHHAAAHAASAVLDCNPAAERCAHWLLWCAAVWVGFVFVGRPVKYPAFRHTETTPARLQEAGLPAHPGAVGDVKSKYLDLVRRAVLNVLYECKPVWYYDSRNQASMPTGYDVRARLQGLDAPTQAHTMVGLRRLNNIQACIETVLKDGVPGDLIETGVLRGGSALFMKAVLEAHGDRERRVFLCDTFMPGVEEPSPGVSLLLLPVIRALAAIPHWGWQKRMFLFLQHRPSSVGASFPKMMDPSEDLVELGMFALQTAAPLASRKLEPAPKNSTTVEGVRCTFAKYGLLDDRVRFLKGFFSDTLPPAVSSGDIGTLALLRLDGDTYESTMTALEPLYPRLSVGGFVIVDDYFAFADCRRGVDEYRSRHGITSELVRVDEMAVCWRKE